jgi:ParB family transcriptional regulator, chromosome partitioning protein
MEHAVELNTGDVKLIPLARLAISERNVRKTNGIDVAELKASIRAQGLLQNLIVCPLATKRGKPNGSFEVVGGGRRLRALQALAEEGELAKDEGIVCRVLPTRQAAEASLSENYQREPMHPADEFEAFHRLVHAGQSIEEVALRFGVSPMTVRRRLKLADVHPALVQLYRDDSITMEQLMALSVSDDQAEQLRVWEAAPAWRRHASYLREALIAEEVDASSDPLALLVGLEAYEAAGGRVRRDLFSDESAGYLQDTELLTRLASERLEAAAEGVRAEGWSWVEVEVKFVGSDLYRFGRCTKSTRPMTKAETKKLQGLKKAFDELTTQQVDEENDAEWSERETAIDEARERLEELEECLRVFGDDAYALGGAVVCVGRKGSIEVHRGLIRPQDNKRAPAGRSSGEGAEQCSGSESTSGGDRPEHSAALMLELTAQRTLAARVTMVNQPRVAMAVLLHCLVQRLLVEGYGLAETSVKLVPNAPDAGLGSKAGSDLGNSKAAQELADARDRWGDRLPGVPAQLLTWLLQLDDSQRMELLALCVAMTLNDVRDTQRAAPLDAVCGALQLDMADWWEPTADGYFSRITKDGILKAITEGAGAEAAARIKGVSKSELARYAERELQGKRWLPSPLKAGGEVGDVEAQD